ncbi:MAG: M13 family metallopeptidase [Gammaproteobacteria bacterium]|nr:M13 family metallopeptidase [Gammaproteobacteria bacterium]
MFRETCRTMRSTVLAAFMASLLCACASTPEPAPTAGSGIAIADLDHSVRPQDDFYRHVNGGWLDRTEIPSDRSRWGSFDELRERSEQQVLAIVQRAAESSALAEQDSDTQKVGDLYRAFMDRERINARGSRPLADDLARIDALDSPNALMAYWGSLQSRLGSAPLGLFVSQDPGDSSRYIVQLSQTGLGLPDRDYYLADDERSREIIASYRAHIERLFDLAGLSGGAAAATRIIALETAIAEGHWTRVANRDRNATYNLMALGDIEALAPRLAWSDYFAAADIPADHRDEINVRQPDYLARLTELSHETPLDHWRDYHRFHLLRQAAPWLDDALVAEHFDFNGRILNGQPEIRPLEKRATSLVERSLGFMVGRMYVDEHYPPEAARRMDTMVKNLLQAFGEALDELDWMTEATRAEAHAKLARFSTKIGQPDVWRDYDCLTIDADDLFGNVAASIRCEHQRQVDRLGQPVDRDEWFMTPQTVNAYYSPAMTEIVFPAAILQPPFFDVDADPAVNYGAIGAVIGHEITHGFDDQGRRVDGDGNLRDWWQPEDEEQFNARAQRMIDQYNAYSPIEGMTINGELALGENIADLGGVRIALAAWQNSQAGADAAVIDGLTGEQRFFMGWAQIWRTLYRDEALRRHLITGPHSPGPYRVKGVLSNLPEFHEAFGVEPGDPMYRSPEERVEIW